LWAQRIKIREGKTNEIISIEGYATISMHVESEVLIQEVAELFCYQFLISQ